jgi:hypothetical protein
VWVLGVIAAAVMIFVFWSSWLPQFIPAGSSPRSRECPCTCRTSSSPGWWPA